MTDFTDLGLAAPILEALAAEGYVSPTPIQAKAIPQILAGRDLLGVAQTGTGKTAAFALPILHRLAADRRAAPHGGCRVLVLSPTRELASQIADSFRAYGVGLNLAVAAVFGGVPHGPQIRALARGLDVLVATPGRLVDHLQAGKANLGATEVLVLDEVDQMLDLGFVQAIRRLVAKLPARRQNLFFSATMPKGIKTLANELLTNPVEVSVAPSASTVERVSQRVMFIETARKRELLIELLADQQMSRAIVFTRTKHGADKVAECLGRAGIGASAIHGNKSQSQRERALSVFRSGGIRVLVATDVAARGIDIDGVTHVINFELPDVAERYVHRIGRTARAGAEGIAISFCDNAERGLLGDIEKLTRLHLPTVDRRSHGGASAAFVPGDERPAQVRNGGRPRPQEQRAHQSESGRRSQNTPSTAGDDRRSLADIAFMAPSRRHTAIPSTR
ncbi:DEAD/DEAH box helicase [Telmatospirillum sp.]|uniref:DEAD/DEAH box helicase n=1 Tax=Telmatospirillum sp. TaxID=2079197 RepID=UPI002844D87E|nr:DEAD/DEAH box helicase [Telmatospirillum sp.]MDR3436254.1 DEAD/DEAH box helicase [Telmatospirillum sp.]